MIQNKCKTYKSVAEKARPWSLLGTNNAPTVEAVVDESVLGGLASALVSARKSDHVLRTTLARVQIHKLWFLFPLGLFLSNFKHLKVALVEKFHYLL
jgi:predicted secreted protein